MGRCRGRPRDPDVSHRILDAALQQLSCKGYAGMCMDEIAKLAGATKPTIYRRWKNKAELAVAALARLQATEMPRGSGDTRADLVAHLRDFQRKLQRPRGLAMIGTLLVEEQAQPELMSVFRDRIVRARRACLCRVIEDGQARGDVADDADPDLAANLLVGAFYARYLATGKLPRGFAARVVDSVWSGIGARR